MSNVLTRSFDGAKDYGREVLRPFGDIFTNVRNTFNNIVSPGKGGFATRAGNLVKDTGSTVAGLLLSPIRSGLNAIPVRPFEQTYAYFVDKLSGVFEFTKNFAAGPRVFLDWINDYPISSLQAYATVN